MIVFPSHIVAFSQGRNFFCWSKWYELIKVYFVRPKLEREGHKFSLQSSMCISILNTKRKTYYNNYKPLIFDSSIYSKHSSKGSSGRDLQYGWQVPLHNI